MIVLLWLGLLLLPIVLGMGVLAIFNRKKKKDSISVSEGCVLGFVGLLGMAQVGHVIGLFANLSIGMTGLLFGGGLLVLCVVVLLAMLLQWRRGRVSLAFLKRGSNERTWIPFLFLVLLLIQVLIIYCMEPVVTPGDITLETVQSFLAEDGIYRVMPLTGQASESGLPLRYMILCLPTLYAVFCQLFGLEAELVVCHVVPVMVLVMAYFGYYHLSGVLFGQEAFKKRYLFLVAVAILLFISNNAAFTNGYGALYGGHIGTTIRNLILVPYTLAAALEKRWWKGLLCVLAEACIVWTFWGFGVCTVVFGGLFLLTLAEKKSVKLRKLMQIFRSGEDLA